MNQTKLILIVDDEAAIREMICFNLRIAGFDCIEAEDEESTIKKLNDRQPDLILMDWMLPGKSGVEIIRRIRSTTPFQEIPIIMLSAKAEEDSRVRGLNFGADDYMIKPFSPRELLARIKAVLRRVTPEDEQGLIRLPGLCLNTTNQTLLINEELLKLTTTEYRLLYFFMIHQDRIYTRAQIIDHVWGTNSYIDERTVDVQIRRLRNVMKKSGAQDLIQTVRGSGYRFSVKIKKSQQKLNEDNNGC
ncbi:MAG: phosphate regulon transcriptional regulator PhoB [Legionellales bacterium]|nr:phosphate regulon transcriptional regulator PhoB [Legionellales bacterium]